VKPVLSASGFIFGAEANKGGIRLPGIHVTLPEVQRSKEDLAQIRRRGGLAGHFHPQGGRGCFYGDSTIHNVLFQSRSAQRAQRGQEAQEYGLFFRNVEMVLDLCGCIRQ
jgi:hypothetical protein